MFAANHIELIEEMCAVGQDAVGRGLVLASGGNLSVRLSDNRFAVSGAGTWLDRLTVDQFVTMEADGSVIDGDRAPSSEWKLHQRAYRTREDAAAVIHLHPQHATLLASFGIEIRLMTLDHAYYVRSVGVTDYHPNGSDVLADSAAEQLRSHNCVVMKHHGCVVVGDSVEMTYRRALNLEEAARATFLARQMGDAETVFPPAAFAALHHA